MSESHRYSEEEEEDEFLDEFASAPPISSTVPPPMRKQDSMIDDDLELQQIEAQQQLKHQQHLQVGTKDFYWHNHLVK